MNYPTVAEFKLQFVRDFPYGTTSDKVLDSDIATAITQASQNINEALFDDETSFKFTMNYLAAHYLVMNLKASSQGVGGSFNWLESSKSIGSVSTSYAIPDAILNNPVFAMLSKTSYGADYLSIVIPRSYGQVGAVAGGAMP